jgi:hypothetical protein
MKQAPHQGQQKRFQNLPRMPMMLMRGSSVFVPSDSQLFS